MTVENVDASKSEIEIQSSASWADLHFNSVRSSCDRLCYSTISVRIINKQNKYPVLLLTQGENSGYEEYQDPRTWSINNGVLFAEMSGLLGQEEEEEVICTHYYF